MAPMHEWLDESLRQGIMEENLDWEEDDPKFISGMLILRWLWNTQ